MKNLHLAADSAQPQQQPGHRGRVEEQGPGVAPLRRQIVRRRGEAAHLINLEGQLQVEGGLVHPEGGGEGELGQHHRLVTVHTQPGPLHTSTWPCTCTCMILTSSGEMAGVGAVSPEQVTTTSATSTTASTCSVTARFPFSTFSSLK